MFGGTEGDQLSGSGSFRWKRAIWRAQKREGPNARARRESCTIGSGEAVSVCSPHPCLLGFLIKRFIRKLRLVSGMRKLRHKVVR